MKRDIPLFRIYWDQNDIDKVTAVIKNGFDLSGRDRDNGYQALHKSEGFYACLK